MWILQQKTTEGWKDTNHTGFDYNLLLRTMDQLRNIFKNRNYRVHEIDYITKEAILYDIYFRDRSGHWKKSIYSNLTSRAVCKQLLKEIVKSYPRLDVRTVYRGEDRDVEKTTKKVA